MKKKAQIKQIPSNPMIYQYHTHPSMYPATGKSNWTLTNFPQGPDWRMWCIVAHGHHPDPESTNPASVLCPLRLVSKSAEIWATCESNNSFNFPSFPVLTWSSWESPKLWGRHWKAVFFQNTYVWLISFTKISILGVSANKYPKPVWVCSS